MLYTAIQDSFKGNSVEKQQNLSKVNLKCRHNKQSIW